MLRKRRARYGMPRSPRWFSNWVRVVRMKLIPGPKKEGRRGLYEGDGVLIHSARAAFLLRRGMVRWVSPPNQLPIMRRGKKLDADRGQFPACGRLRGTIQKESWLVDAIGRERQDSAGCVIGSRVKPSSVFVWMNSRVLASNLVTSS